MSASWKKKKKQGTRARKHEARLHRKRKSLERSLKPTKPSMGRQEYKENVLDKIPRTRKHILQLKGEDTQEICDLFNTPGCYEVGVKHVFSSNPALHIQGPLDWSYVFPLGKTLEISSIHEDYEDFFNYREYYLLEKEDFTTWKYNSRKQTITFV